MHNFWNTNYLSINTRPAGVYLLHNRQNRLTRKFYFVRVVNEKGVITTMAKCDTLKEAQKIFRKHMGKEMEMHYEEIGNLI